MGDSKYKNPYQQESHRKHKLLGFCPSIHWSKTWCSRAAGHTGLHRAPTLEGKSLVWDDSAEHPKWVE